MIRDIEPSLYPDLSQEISDMAEEDQKMRRKAVSDDSWDESIDKRNTQRIKEIVETIGWPSKSKVGKIPSQQAWLLVQHADNDVPFQKKCLELMRSAGPKEVEPQHLAYLEDRINVNKGEEQVYGTQFFRDADGKMKPRPIREPNLLDQRRAKVGLEPFDEYAKGFNNPNNPWVKK